MNDGIRGFTKVLMAGRSPLDLVPSGGNNGYGPSPSAMANTGRGDVDQTGGGRSSAALWRPTPCRSRRSTGPCSSTGGCQESYLAPTSFTTDYGKQFAWRVVRSIAGLPGLPVVEYDSRQAILTSGKNSEELQLLPNLIQVFLRSENRRCMKATVLF